MQQSTMVKRSSEAKKNAAIASIAMQLAKTKNDVLSEKASKHKKLLTAAREAILKKYGPQARSEYMKKK